MAVKYGIWEQTGSSENGGTHKERQEPASSLTTSKPPCSMMGIAGKAGTFVMKLNIP